MCDKCYKELTVTFNRTKIEGVEVLSIYDYNEAMKTMLYTLKGLGDIVIAKTMLERHQLYFKMKYFNYVLLPAPSTKESENIRGFNHVIEIFKGINKNFINLLSKIEDFKQSDLSFAKRQEVINKLVIKDGKQLRNKKLLIVDDLKTTGATIRAIITLVKPFSPRKIKVLTLAATKVNT